MEAVLGSFAWHAGAVETVRALGLETSIACGLFVVALVVTGVCIVHEERKRKRSSTLRIAAGKKES